MTAPATIEVQREVQDSVVTFKVAGTFDARTAVCLRKALKEVGHAARVVIDFSGVRQFVEVGVAVLSGGLQSGSVELRGLSRRQMTMFRYFDIDVDRDEGRPFFQPQMALGT